MAPASDRLAATSPTRVAVVMALGLLCVSSGAVLARLAQAPPLATATYRLGLASLALTPYGILTDGAAMRRLSRSEALRAGMAGLALAIHFALWIASLAHTSVASSVALVTLHPLVVAAAAPALLGERVRRDLVLGAVLAVFGAAVIARGDSGEGRALIGDLLAVGGGVAFAGYVLTGRRLRASVPLRAYVALVYGVAAVALLAAALVTRTPLTGYPGSTWLAFVAMAAIPQVIGHSSFNWALSHVSATYVSATIVGEVLGSTLLAWLVLRERPPGTSMAGGGLVIFGLLVAGVAEQRSRSAVRWRAA